MAKKSEGARGKAPAKSVASAKSAPKRAAKETVASEAAGKSAKSVRAPAVHGGAAKTAASPETEAAAGALIRPPEPRAGLETGQSALTAELEAERSPMLRAVRPETAAPAAAQGQCLVREAAQRLGPQETREAARDIRFAHLLDDAVAPVEMRSPDATQRILEVVIGFDDRRQVSPTTDYAWRCICKLRITAADGSPWVGTGWLTGPGLVVTAGHCVHIANRGGWVRQIEVTPAADGLSAPFGVALARSFRSVQGWVEDQTGQHDYGAILLPPEARFGDTLGYFGIAALDDASLAAADLHLSGYPADKPPGTQWHHARQVSWLEPETLFYDIDTTGGQSGSPVWTSVGGTRYAVGVHRAGQSTGNSAVRLTDPSFDNIMHWNDEAT